MKTILFLLSIILFAQYACFNKHRLGRYNINPKSNKTSISFLQQNSTNLNDDNAFSSSDSNGVVKSKLNSTKLIPGKTYIRIRRHKNSTKVTKEYFTVSIKNNTLMVTKTNPSKTTITKINSKPIAKKESLTVASKNITGAQGNLSTSISTYNILKRYNTSHGNISNSQENENVFSTPENKATNTSTSENHEQNDSNVNDTKDSDDNKNPPSDDDKLTSNNNNIINQSPFHKIFYSKSEIDENSLNKDFLDVDDYAQIENEEESQDGFDDENSEKNSVDVESH